MCVLKSCNPSIENEYLRTATDDRLIGRLKDAPQLRQAVVFHLKHYVGARRAIVVEIVVVPHQFLRVADIAEDRVRLHFRRKHNSRRC